MNNLKQGPISSNDLMAGLAKAKKLISKVDTGDFQKGFINENDLLDGDYNISDPEEMIECKSTEPRSKFKVTGENSVEKIQNSRLPDAIKKVMIESPIPQISLNDTIDMDFVKGAKRLMEQEGYGGKPTVKPQSRINNPTMSNSDLASMIIPIIENIVRKTVNEILDKKLDQLLTAQKTMSINENLVLKVGDSVFRGKITAVNKSK